MLCFRKPQLQYTGTVTTADTDVKRQLSRQYRHQSLKLTSIIWVIGTAKCVLHAHIDIASPHLSRIRPQDLSARVSPEEAGYGSFRGAARSSM